MSAGWVACGLFLYNPDRVFRNTPQPSIELAVSETDVIQSGSCSQDEVIQSPVTPVSVEALTSLYSVIQQDTHTLDGTSTGCLQKYIEKLANTAQNPLLSLPSFE